MRMNQSQPLQNNQNLPQNWPARQGNQVQQNHLFQFQGPPQSSQQSGPIDQADDFLSRYQALQKNGSKARISQPLIQQQQPMVQPLAVNQNNNLMANNQMNSNIVPQQQNERKTQQEWDPLVDPQHYQTMLEQIMNCNLHLDSEYISIYGLNYTTQYLRDAKSCFTAAYHNLMKSIQNNDKLIRWYQFEVKPYHDQFGISAIFDPRWAHFGQNLSILSIKCIISITHSDPFTNFADLIRGYHSIMNERMELLKEQEDQYDAMKDLQVELYSRETIDICSLKQLSFLAGMNIMLHRHVIPSPNPLLIKNGLVVNSDKFPKYNIIQLFTLDDNLFYRIFLNIQDKHFLDQYIHYDVNIQRIDYTHVALQVLDDANRRLNKANQEKMKEKQQEIVAFIKNLKQAPDDEDSEEEAIIFQQEIEAVLIEIPDQQEEKQNDDELDESYEVQKANFLVNDQERNQSDNNHNDQGI